MHCERYSPVEPVIYWVQIRETPSKSNGKDSGLEVLTSVTSEVDYHNYGKRSASKTRP